MPTTLRYLTTGAALCVLAMAAAQEPLRAPTLQERVATLEVAVAGIETRFGVQSARPADIGAESGVALAGRLTALENALDRLTNDLQRVDRLADGAVREAAQARREATAAQQAARDAALRR